MVPEPVPRETTDPNPAPAPAEDGEPGPLARFLRRAAERATWAQVVVGVALAVFAAGVTTHSAVAKLATKADLDAAMKAHAATPHGPDLARRLDELETWRAAHQAESSADLWWIKQSIGALLEHQGLPRPPDRAPPPTPTPQRP